jgi:hypothetical protein
MQFYAFPFLLQSTPQHDWNEFAYVHAYVTNAVIKMGNSPCSDLFERKKGNDNHIL